MVNLVKKIHFVGWQSMYYVSKYEVVIPYKSWDMSTFSSKKSEVHGKYHVKYGLSVSYAWRGWTFVNIMKLVVVAIVGNMLWS
jgi:hypothetical protein